MTIRADFAAPPRRPLPFTNLCWKTQALLDWLAAGRLDLVLMAFPYETPGCETFMLFDDTYRFACSSRHPLAKADVVNMQALDGEALMFLEKDQYLHSHALPLFDIAVEEAVTSFAATSLHTLIAMVAENLGTTLLPDLAINGGVLQGSSVAIRPIAGKSNYRQIGFAWRKQSARSEAFIRLGHLMKSWAVSNVKPFKGR
jgi:LysR family hydrogen peroxide-inducible transcriptional activator